MYFITRKHLSRRTFLRGTGAALALPLLDSMTPAMSAPAPAQPRLAAIYVPHGVTLRKWTPRQVGNELQLSEILQPLEKHKSRLNVFSGLDLPSAYGDDASAEANHTRSSACFLSGAMPVLGARAQLGTTLDQVVARKLGQDTPLPSLELGIEGPAMTCGTNLSCAYRNSIAWLTPTTPLPAEVNPQVVFERMFGDGATEAERRARREQSRSMLDTLRSEIASLDKRLPAADRHRLGEYVNDVREIERRIANAAARPGPDGEAPSTVPADFDTHVKLHFDLLTLAWRADVTRVATMPFAQETSNAAYPASGITDAFHALSHHSNIEANKDRFAILNRYHVGLLGYLLDKLAATPDGDGNLLDRAMVLYGSGISDGNLHDHGPLPILLAGGACGKLPGNRHIEVPKNTPLANLQLTMLHLLGIEAAKFADSTGTVSISA
jgi:hypothetical protein